MTDTTSTITGTTIYPLNPNISDSSVPYLSTYTTDPQGATADNMFVRLVEYKHRHRLAVLHRKQIDEAVLWMDEHMRDDHGDQPYREQVTFTLAEINDLLARLGAEPLTQKKTYRFAATVSYTVEGEVTVSSESEAEDAVNALIEDMSDPEYTEPGIKGEWEWVEVSYSETDDIDISEA